MATSSTTTNLGLNRPEYSDFADVADIQQIVDTLDEVVVPKESIIDMIYPIGSIYMSAASTDPATIMTGTTWVRLKDRFLLGAGDTYEAAATGGAASVSYTPRGTNAGTAITVDQMPSHNHTFTGSSVTTSSGGGSHTHTVGAHSHGLNSHVHSLNSHTHTFAANTENDTVKVFNQKTGFWSSNAVGGSQLPVLSFSSSTSGRVANLYVSGTTGAASGNTGAASGNTANSSAFNSGSTSIAHTHTVTAAGSIGNKGGGNTHTHTFNGTAATIATMPPYLTVYMWQRTA